MVERAAPPTALASRGVPDSIAEVTPQAFENHQERTATGKYAPADRTIAAGACRVPMTQPLARLAFCRCVLRGPGLAETSRGPASPAFA